MADINAWYSRLLAAGEARDAAALAAVAWQMYGQLATTAADLGALRARFRVYAAAPRASGRRRPGPRGGQGGDRAAAAQPRRPAPRGKVWTVRSDTASAWQPTGTPATHPPRARP